MAGLVDGGDAQEFRRLPGLGTGEQRLEVIMGKRPYGPASDATGPTSLSR